ncbi:alpha/beta fold hydrolase [Novosphingobium beihaiensis]|uniref:Alpha/beta hydrolase n=1 Tax=Novosphingobium beihaiensis TaxID=2930389 RepID=A0ABT0BU17_9SPHN|nr:alpha/beta hydrolase [Novosphingobium beihaiensis]MCJ2188174.1 alpha/beta hydrolase [Novosphingobium beihaiensis]
MIPAGARESTWHAPDGWKLRRIDWPAPEGAPRGSMLFMPGRGDTYEKWLESLDQWHGAGWQMTSADWRGQACSGRLGKDALTGHIDDFATWVEDYAALWDSWSRHTVGPRVAIGHSMGGHLVLRAVVERRIQADAVVLSAPMLGLHPAWMPSRLLYRVAKVIAGMGDRRRPAWKGNEKPELVAHARSMLLTHDLSRYEDELWWREQRPEIEMGAASWGWIEQALASIRLLERPGMLEAVCVPVLLLGTRTDSLVSWPAIREAARRLPKGELVTFGKECHHEILREADPVRDRAMDAIREFLDRAVPARG